MTSHENLIASYSYYDSRGHLILRWVVKKWL